MSLGLAAGEWQCTQQCHTCQEWVAACSVKRMSPSFCVRRQATGALLAAHGWVCNMLEVCCAACSAWCRLLFLTRPACTAQRCGGCDCTALEVQGCPGRSASATHQTCTESPAAQLQNRGWGGTPSPSTGVCLWLCHGQSSRQGQGPLHGACAAHSIHCHGFARSTWQLPPLPCECWEGWAQVLLPDGLWEPAVQPVGFACILLTRDVPTCKHWGMCGQRAPQQHGWLGWC